MKNTRFQVWFVAFLLALLGVFAWAQQETQQASDLFNAGKYQEAIQMADAALVKNPKDAQALNTRGAAKHMLAQYAAAIADYDLAIANGLANDTVWSNRGRSNRALGNLELSIKDFTKALEVNPKAFQALYERSESYAQLKDWDKALADAEASVKINGKYAPAQGQVGEVSIALGDYKRADSALSKAIDLEPKNSTFYANRTVARRRLGNGKGALSDAEKVIQLGVTGPGAYNARALAKMTAKDYKGALADFDKIIAESPKTAVYVANKGRCLYYMGELDAAEAELNKALILDENSTAALRYRAELNEKRGNLEAAKADAVAANFIDPNDVEIRKLTQRLAPDEVVLPNKTAAASEVAVEPEKFGAVPEMGAILVSKAPDKPESDPKQGVLWAVRPPLVLAPVKADPIQIPPAVEWANLNMAAYNWAVTAAKEGMRVVMGPMAEEEERQYEAKWAPYYDAPTPEVLAYLNNLNPLLGEFISARSGYTNAAQEAAKALQEAGVLSEAKFDAESKAAVDAAKFYKKFMDGYEASMRAILAKIDALGPMPNPYEARRKRAKRTDDEIKRLGPAKKTDQPATPKSGRYYVLAKIVPSIPTLNSANVKLTAIEGSVSISGTGRPWYVEKGNITYDIKASWTPFPRIIADKDGTKATIQLRANCNLQFTDVDEAAIKGFQLKENFGTYIHIGAGILPTDGMTYASCRADGTKPSGSIDCDLYKLLDAGGYYGIVYTEGYEIFVTVQTPAAPVTYQYIYKRIELTAEQAAEIDAKAKQDLAELNKGHKEAEVEAEANSAKVARMSYLMSTRDMFTAERSRIQQEMKNAPASSQKELFLRFLYADAQASATNDNIQYAQTGQWVRTRTLYDDYDFQRMQERGREEAARLSLPLKAIKAAEAQIQLAPAHLKEGLKDKLRTGITPEMMRGLDGEGIRKLATAIAGEVQEYWTKQSGRESFRATVADYAETGVKIGAGVIICGAGSVYVAGLGVQGVALWAADTLIGAAYGGASGYVEGGPEMACKKSLEWAGMLGFAASTAIDAYGETGSGTEALTATARGVALAMTFQYATAFVGKTFFGKPTVQEQFAMAKFQQEMEYGQALIQRSNRAQAAVSQAMNKGVKGAALAKIEKELAEATAAVNGSWHAKVLLKYGADQLAAGEFVQQVEKLYAKVQPDFVNQLRAMGYEVSGMKFEPVRNASSCGTVGIDLDLKLVETPGMVLRKNGKVVSLSTFNRDAQKAYNKAYFKLTGYSAQQSLINITTTAHQEAFTGKMIQAEIPFSTLTGIDRQRAGGVLIAKTAGVELEGFTKAVEASRAMEKEIRIRLLPDLKTQLTKASSKGDKAAVQRIKNSIEFWEQIRTNTEAIGQGQTNPGVIWEHMEGLKALTGGKDVFELAQALADYWPALGKFK